MKKILFVSGALGRGGAERVITILANEYKKKEWEVHIATLLEDEVGYNLNESIVLHDLTKKGKYKKNVIHWVINLRKLIKQEKPDVVLSFVGRVNLITMLAATGLKIPIVISERNDPAKDRRNRLEIKLCKYFYGKADCIVFQTNYQKEFYGARCKKNGVIIGNPISAKVYKGEHANKNIISVGKLMKQKNHNMLIKAFAKISKYYPEKKVHIFGDGELREDLQNLIDTLGMHEKIILEGNSNDIFEKLHKYQYFVMTSDYEGLSNALLEAMISGMTCISTSWGGIEDVIEDNLDGYLVPVGDVDALADKLKKVLDVENNEICSKGIEKAATYELEHIKQQWFEAIEKVIK